MSESVPNADGLTVPAMTEWPIFPFVGDLEVRELLPNTGEERVRVGDPGGPKCSCQGGDSFRPLDPIWAHDGWLVRRLRFGDREAPFPAYMLETEQHIDFGEMSDEQAQQFGLLSLRIERAIMSLGTVGRVHINRWGDGGSHMHVWFLGRPAGAWQFSGYSLPLWGFILPSLDAETHKANDAAIAEAMNRTVG